MVVRDLRPSRKVPDNVRHHNDEREKPEQETMRCLPIDIPEHTAPGHVQIPTRAILGSNRFTFRPGRTEIPQGRPTGFRGSGVTRMRSVGRGT